MSERVRHELVWCAAPLVIVATLLSAALASGATAATTDTLRGSITVSAASSLSAAFTQIAAKFHKLHPHTTIVYNFGSSTTLANQILAGAPVDVFASADLTDMDSVVTGGYVHVAPNIFTRNQIEIAVKRGNPTGITGLGSLANAPVVAECGTSVPCGIYAANMLKHAGVNIPANNVTRQPNSQSTVDQVSYGDATAAIVYVTDVNSQGKLVSGVKIPANQNIIADYPIARLSTSANSKLAQAFVSFVESKNGQRSLTAQGFLAR